MRSPDQPVLLGVLQVTMPLVAAGGIHAVLLLPAKGLMPLLLVLRLMLGSDAAAGPVWSCQRL